jgi:hypothetical protein
MRLCREVSLRSQARRQTLFRRPLPRVRPRTPHKSPSTIGKLAEEHVDGRPTVYIPVTKRSDASTLAVIQAVKAAIPSFKKVMPDAEARVWNVGTTQNGVDRRDGDRGQGQDGYLLLTGHLLLPRPLHCSSPKIKHDAHDYLQTPHFPPNFAQWAQYLQFLQALHGSLPVQVAKEALARIVTTDKTATSGQTRKSRCISGLQFR